MKSHQKGKRSRGVGDGSNKLMMEFSYKIDGVLFELFGAGSVVVVVVTATDNGGLHSSSFSIHSFTKT